MAGSFRSTLPIRFLRRSVRRTRRPVLRSSDAEGARLALFEGLGHVEEVPEFASEARPRHVLVLDGHEMGLAEDRSPSRFEVVAEARQEPHEVRAGQMARSGAELVLELLLALPVTPPLAVEPLAIVVLAVEERRLVHDVVHKRIAHF